MYSKKFIYNVSLSTTIEVNQLYRLIFFFIYTVSDITFIFNKPITISFEFLVTNVSLATQTGPIMCIDLEMRKRYNTVSVKKLMTLLSWQ